MSADETKKGGKVPSNALTDRENEVLAKAWLCMKSPPELDIEKLARLTNYTNPRSVSNLMGAIRKKISASAAEDGHGSDVSAPATPAKGKGQGGRGKGTGTPASSARKRKSVKSAATAVDDDDDDGNGDDRGSAQDEDELATPSKRAKVARGKKAAAAAAVVKAEEDEKPAGAAAGAAPAGLHEDDVDADVKDASFVKAEKKGDESMYGFA